MSNLVTHDQLLQLTGCKRIGDLEKTLRKNGVRFLYGRDCIYTTVDALNAAMGLLQNPPQPGTDEETIIL